MRTRADSDQPDLDEFLGRLARADRAGATELVTDLIAAGWSLDDVVAGLLVPAQHAVGMRWQTTMWSVADEHAASATVDAVLARAAFVLSAAEFRSTVVLACAEGEWHSLAGRMQAELLRVRGWRAMFLGGSLPADDLGRFVARIRPLALLVSCSVSIHLPGALRSIEAGHRAGVPVVAGGRGFGPDGQRAMRLGADAWAAGIDDLSDLLDRWERYATPAVIATAAGIGDEHLRLQAAAGAVVARSLRALRVRGLEPSATNVTYLVQALVAATLTDDVRLLTEAVAWLTDFLATRGFPANAAGAMIEVIARCLPPELTGASGLIERVRAG